MSTILSFNVTEGRLMPLEHDFTEPPPGLSRHDRRAWKRRFKDRKSQYDDSDQRAWYRASDATYQQTPEGGFDRESEALRVAFEAEHGVVDSWFYDEASAAAWAAGRPERAKFIADMRALSMNGFG